MSRISRSLSELFGNDPKKPVPDDYTPEAKDLHAFQRTDEETKKRVDGIKVELAEKHAHPPLEKLRLKRWAVLLLVNLLFVFPFTLISSCLKER